MHAGHIRYKVDILQQLREAGWTSYKIRQEKVFGERNLTQMRNGELVSWAVLEKVCCMLGCQPGDLIEYKEGIL